MSSLSPLNQQLPRSLLLYGTQIVMSTSPCLNRQVYNHVLLSPIRAGSFCCQVNTMISEQRIVILVSLSWPCQVNHLWHDGCPNPIHPYSPYYLWQWIQNL